MTRQHCPDCPKLARAAVSVRSSDRDGHRDHGLQCFAVALAIAGRVLVRAGLGRRASAAALLTDNRPAGLLPSVWVDARAELRDWLRVVGGADLLRQMRDAAPGAE